MGVPSAPTPPVGTVGVGELLADAQSRTVWLGVPGSINPAQSLLVADIVGLMEEDAATLEAAQDYADGLAAGKSDVGHHHAIADVDGLPEALEEASSTLPVGCIVIWHGILADIPTGWRLCNGSFGTPDLRDRFVLGAGGSIGTAGSTGGARLRNLSTGTAGDHIHNVTVANTSLTIAQMPVHNHTITDPGHTHTVTDPGHTHHVPAAGGAGGITAISAANNHNAPNTIDDTDSATTGITIQSKVTGITINNRGNGDGHTHTASLTAAPGHLHTIPEFDVMPPYIILGYIMKV